VTNHHAIDNAVLRRSRIVARKGAEDCEFLAIQLFARPDRFSANCDGHRPLQPSTGEMFPCQLATPAARSALLNAARVP